VVEQLLVEAIQAANDGCELGILRCGLLIHVGMSEYIRLALGT
jgi:hypothetical protein